MAYTTPEKQTYHTEWDPNQVLKVILGNDSAPPQYVYKHRPEESGGDSLYTIVLDDGAVMIRKQPLNDENFIEKLSSDTVEDYELITVEESPIDQGEIKNDD